MVYGIRRLFQCLHDILDLDNLDGILFLFKQLLDEKRIDNIRLGFYIVQLHAAFAQGLGLIPETIQLMDRPVQAVGPLSDQVANRAAAVGNRTGIIEGNTFGAAVDAIDHIVQGGCQIVDVFPVEGRDESGAQLIQDFLAQFIAFMFQILDFPVGFFPVLRRGLRQARDQGVRRFDQGFRQLIQQGIKFGLFGSQTTKKRVFHPKRL